MLTIDDLLANQSVSREGAEVLRTIAASGRSFLVHALPQGAGKTTTVQAILAAAPLATPRTEFLGTEHETAALTKSPARGYLLVPEIGHHGRPGYLAGDEVPRVFDLVAVGYSLASSLHADSVDEVHEVLGANGVPVDVAATIPYLVKVRVLRNEAETHVRRVVDEIHEIQISADRTPTSTQLYRWDGLSEGNATSWVEAPPRRHRDGGRRG